MSMHGAGPDILLVEDSPGDVMLVREVLKGLDMCGEIYVVGDGNEAISFLKRDGCFMDAPVPDLILLDLNLPGIDGREVLREIKGHPEWRRIPVAVLSTSKNEDDVVSSYELSANCYIVKPLDLASFRRAMQALNDFWFSVVKFPPKH